MGFVEGGRVADFIFEEMGARKRDPLTNFFVFSSKEKLIEQALPEVVGK